MKPREIHLHLVSDVAGGTLTIAARAAASLYPKAAIIEHIHPPVRAVADLGRILKDIELQPGTVLYVLNDFAMVRNVRDGCAAIGCQCLAMPTSSGGVGKAASDPGLKSVVRLRVEERRLTWFAIATGSYAIVLAILALWFLPSALIRPTIVFPPIDAAAARTVASQAERAHVAASIGILRGDLWADYAFALASVPLREFEEGKAITAPQLIEPARSAARRAAELSPHYSRVWLLLAALDSQIDNYKNNVPVELKFSYYTGPNESALRPLRIRTALAFDAIADTDLQSLVTSEVKTITKQVPALEPWIIAAYRHGSSDGRHFLEHILGNLELLIHKADHPQ